MSRTNEIFLTSRRKLYALEYRNQPANAYDVPTERVGFEICSYSYDVPTEQRTQEILTGSYLSLKNPGAS